MKSSTGARKAQTSAETSRRQSVRQARSTALRPTNYYARPFPSFGGQAEDTAKNAAPGFFPAIQHFTDSVDALPKEVVRHFSMLKEVEAKVHGPDEFLTQLHQTIFDLPTPPRRPPQALAQNLMSFTANNSVNGSAPASVINGSVSSLPQQSAEVVTNLPVDDEADLRRRQLFYQLRKSMVDVMLTLDEKNAVVATANHTLSKQLARMDSSFPSVEEEISEEARLGSLNHWAYKDKETRRANGTTTTERRGRDAAAAQSLAAAAAAIHEGDVAAHRSEQRRQAVAERRTRAPVDSDFDDRPAKKSHHGKARKGADTVADTRQPGLSANGASTASTIKRRKVEKGGAAATERSIAAAFRGSGPGNSPRESPVAESSRKKTKAAPSAPAIRKRVAAGSNGSPSLASSPLQATFAATRDFSPVSERPIPARARQSSTSKPTQATALAGVSRNGSISSASNRHTNGVGVSTPELRSVADVTGRPVSEVRSGMKESYENQEGEHVIEESNVRGALVVNDEPQHDNALKREDAAPETGDAIDDIEPPAPAPAPIITRSGRQSKTATPITATFPDVPMARSRSTRNNSTHTSNGNGNGGPADSTSTHAGSTKRQHKRGTSSVQQQSLDTSRTASKPTSPEPSRVPLSRNSSRTAPDNDDAAPANDAEELEGEIEGEDEEMDENEPRYCYCNGVSYGEMVACDNDSCSKEWFHLSCVGLSKPPSSKTKWYCDSCKEEMKKARPSSRQ